LCVYDGVGIRAMWPVPYEENGKTPDVYRMRKMFTAMKIKGVERALIEIQQAFAKQGAVSAWNNSAGYWSLLASLQWSDIQWERIRSMDWKREMGIPVPSGPEFDLPPLTKRPEIPKKPRLKQHKQAERAWKKIRKIEERERAKVQGRIKTERKRLACEMAQEEQPDYDFRLSERARKPHSGKCESFLLALLAWRRQDRA